MGEGGVVNDRIHTIMENLKTLEDIILFWENFADDSLVGT